jgi:citrate lyase subunit gamma (acyl carrier protein)
LTSVLNAAQAGTLESNDILIIVAPGDNGIALDLESLVIKQYGAAIAKTIIDTVKSFGVTDLNVKAIDKGALDYAIRARVATALTRAEVSPRTPGL